MRLSRRGQVIACVAIVAGVVLLVSLRFFVAPQPLVHEPVAARSAPLHVSPPPLTDNEPATQLVAPAVAPSAEPVPAKPRGQTLTGRVFDQATSAGIAAAVLSYRDMQVGRYDGNWRSRPQTTANADGAFRFDDVPPGRIVIDVSKPGYANREVYVGVAAGSSPLLEIGMTAGAAITGRLTAADSVTPVSGNVELANLEEGAAVIMKTDAGGEFSYTALAPGSYRLTGHGNSGFVERDVSIAAGERIDDLVLALQAGGTMRGTITGLRAQDLARTTVSFRRLEQSSGLLTTRLDKGGNYVMTGLPGGLLQVLVDTKSRMLGRNVDLPAGGDVTVDFDFRRGSRLSGRVMRRGRPLADVAIYQTNSSVQGAFLHSVKTSADGEYAFDDVPDGDYYFSVGNYLAPPVRVSGDTVFDFDVPLLTIAGVVVDAARREPLPWVNVYVAPAPPGHIGRQRQAQTDPFGKFELDTPQPGDYVVSIYKVGYAMVRERVTIGAGSVDLRVVLEEDDGIKVRLRSADGAPIRFAFVYESSASMHVRGWPLRLDERGEGRLPSAFVGSHVRLTVEGFAQLDVPRWNGDELDLRLVPEGAR